MDTLKNFRVLERRQKKRELIRKTKMESKIKGMKRIRRKTDQMSVSMKRLKRSTGRRQSILLATSLRNMDKILNILAQKAKENILSTI